MLLMIYSGSESDPCYLSIFGNYKKYNVETSFKKKQSPEHTIKSKNLTKMNPIKLWLVPASKIQRPKIRNNILIYRLFNS